MASVAGTSETSVGSLLGESPGKGPSAAPPRRPVLLDRKQVAAWAARDSARAAGVEEGEENSQSDSTGVHALLLKAATAAAVKHKARSCQLEEELAALHAQAGAARGAAESREAAQAALLARVQQLEAALAAAEGREQGEAAAAARAASRATAAEAALAGREARQQQEAAQLAAQHAEEMAALRSAAQEEQQRQRAEHAALAAGAEALQANLEAEREGRKALEREVEGHRSRREGLRELMRHSEAQAAAVDRLRREAGEERERAAAAEAAAADAARGMREATAELQAGRAEADGLRAQVAELGAQCAQRDAAAEAAARQASSLQAELSLLQTALAEAQRAGRAEFSAEAETLRDQLGTANEKVAQQSAALARVAAAMAAHADVCSGGGVAMIAASPGAATSPARAGSGSALPHSERVALLVEGVSASWQEERGELVRALDVAEAARCQLAASQGEERQEGREAAAAAGRAQAEAAEALQKLLWAEEQLVAMDSTRGERDAAVRALDCCRGELAAAAAAAATAGDECAKWQGRAASLEGQLAQARQECEAAGHEAAEAAQLAAARGERIKELRSTLAGTMEAKSASEADARAELCSGTQALRAACAAAAEQLDALSAAHPKDPQAAELACTLQAVAAGLRAVPPAEEGLAACVDALTAELGRLCGAACGLAPVLAERDQVHRILVSMSGKLLGASSDAPRLEAAPPGDPKPQQAVAPPPLVVLLQRLTQGILSLVEGMRAEEACLSSRLMHAADDAARQRSQISALESALALLQSPAAPDLAEAVMVANEATARVQCLEVELAELAARERDARREAEDVRAASGREWTSVRDDITRMVALSEQAQQDALRLAEQQAAAHAEELDGAQAQLRAALAVRDESEAAAVDLHHQAQQLAEQVQHAERAAAQAAAAHASALDASTAAVAAEAGRARAEAGRELIATRQRAEGLLQHNARLQEALAQAQEKAAKAECVAQQSAQQLREARAEVAAMREGTDDAAARMAKAEALLRTAEERRVRVEEERRRAEEARARLEQHALLLETRLAAAAAESSGYAGAPGPDRAAAAASAQRDADRAALSAALAQLHMAEAALRDSQHTCKRLLADFSAAQGETRQLRERVAGLEGRDADLRRALEESSPSPAGLAANPEVAVHALQQQLEAKAGLIRQLRSALEAERRVANPACGAVQQRLDAASRQLESVKCLNANLGEQLQQAQTAREELQALLSQGAARLASLAGQAPTQPMGTPGGGPASAVKLQFEAQLGALESHLATRSAELAAAGERGAALASQLAERSAEVEALRAARPGASSTQGLLAAFGSPVKVDRVGALPAGGTPQGEGLDRIIALWREACAAKDRDAEELRDRLARAQDVLATAQVEVYSLRAQVASLRQRESETGDAAEALQSEAGEVQAKAALLESALADAQAQVELLTAQARWEAADAEALRQQLDQAWAATPLTRQTAPGQPSSFKF